MLCDQVDGMASEAPPPEDVGAFANRDVRGQRFAELNLCGPVNLRSDGDGEHPEGAHCRANQGEGGSEMHPNLTHRDMHTHLIDRVPKIPTRIPVRCDWLDPATDIGGA